MVKMVADDDEHSKSFLRHPCPRTLSTHISTPDPMPKYPYRRAHRCTPLLSFNHLKLSHHQTPFFRYLLSPTFSKTFIFTHQVREPGRSEVSFEMFYSSVTAKDLEPKQKGPQPAPSKKGGGAANQPPAASEAKGESAAEAAPGAK